MVEGAVLSDVEYFKRIGLVFALSIGLFIAVGRIIGEERKAKWFKKRTKYSLFTRRSIFGEFIHFGRPCSKEGCLIFAGLFVSIFSFGYWYIFCY